MENNIEGLDDDPDQDSIEEELDKMDEKVGKAPVKSKSAKAQPQEEEAPIPDTFAAYHQEEQTAIVNNLTGDVISKGFKDQGVAMAFADLFNKLEKISIATGAQ